MISPEVTQQFVSRFGEKAGLSAVLPKCLTYTSHMVIEIFLNIYSCNFALTWICVSCAGDLLATKLILALVY